MIPILIIFFLSTSVVYADEFVVPAQKMMATKVFKDNIVDIQNEGTHWESRIHYSVYGRVFLIEEQFPLDYNAITEIEWYPQNYLWNSEEFGESYRGVMKQEKSSVYKDDKRIAGYTIDFNEQEVKTSVQQDGVSVVINAFKVIKKIFNIEEDPTEYIEQKLN